MQNHIISIVIYYCFNTFVKLIIGYIILIFIIYSKYSGYEINNYNLNLQIILYYIYNIGQIYLNKLPMFEKFVFTNACAYIIIVDIYISNSFKFYSFVMYFFFFFNQLAINLISTTKFLDTNILHNKYNFNKQNLKYACTLQITHSSPVFYYYVFMCYLQCLYRKTIN